MEVTNIVLAVIGLIAAVAVPIAIHRATHPKRRVSYFLSIRPQIPVPAPPGRTSAAGLTPPAGWPMLVTVAMWSSGRADVPTSLFDGARPIAFQFGSPIRGMTIPAHDLPEFGAFMLDGDARLDFPPALVGADRVFTAEVAVSWPVRCVVRHPLIDVPVIETKTPPERSRSTSGARRFTHNGMFWGVAQLVLGFALMVIAVALVGTPLAAALGLLYLLFIVSGLLTVVITGIVRLTRWLNARAKQRRSTGAPTDAAREAAATGG